MRSRMILALIVSAAAAHSVAIAREKPDDLRITYASFAKRHRAPEESLLPKGIQPCAKYPESAGPVLSLGAGTTPPQRIRFTRPDYSVLKREKPVGILFAEVIIDEFGRPRSIHVLRSVSRKFDELFFQEMRSSEFRPAQRDGKAVALCMVYTARPHYR